MLPNLAKLFDPSALRWSLRTRALSRRVAKLPMAEQAGIERLGTEYGGWAVPLSLVRDDWMVYSVGAGHDVSFDVELLRRTGARVRAFDPFERHLRSALEQAGHDPRYTVHPYAVAAHDGVVRLGGSPDPATGQITAFDRAVGVTFDAPVRSLRSIAAELGDERVDLLKLDVEGSEYDLLDSLPLEELGVRVLCVELHPTVSAGRAMAQIRRLQARGYAPVARGGTDVTLLRR